jgi:hypothetical protein
MNELIAQQWVAALRSGNYMQGKGFLHNKDENTFCCLGVLCDMYVQEVGNRDTFCKERLTADTKLVTVFGDATGTLPDEVRIWSGVHDDNGQFKYDKPIPSKDASFYNDVETTLLTGMNDGEYGHDFTFEEIANIIEKNWMKL